MPRKSSPLNLASIRTTSLAKRPSKISVRECGTPHRKSGSFKTFLNSLPDTLAARDLRTIARIIAGAHRAKKRIIAGMGAHVIKVGLSPIIIDLMRRRLISCVALNGAGAIHDVEIALAGKTSEDVAAGLAHGQFGMAAEAAEFINRAVAGDRHDRTGMGRAIGEALLARRAPFVKMSILAAAARLDIPCTIHVSIGSDTIHMHPTFDGAATGRASHDDFITFADQVRRLSGGVYLNIGSAVVLPEVFLKAVSLSANLGKAPRHLTTVNMDFIRHYRPSVNVVERPTRLQGKGFNLIGHHEIMLPLLAAALIEEL